MQGSTCTQPRHWEEVGWLILRSVTFTSGESTRYSFYRRVSGPQDQSGVDPDGAVVIIFTTGFVRGFKHGLVRWIFQSVKTLSMTSFRREVKPLVPCRRFTACKRTSKPRLEPLSKISRTFHAQCRKRR